MSGTWSKEDRYHFDNSEVMKEFETRVIDTIKRADILQEKISTAAPDFGDIASGASKAADSVAGLNKQIDQLATAEDGSLEDEACDSKSDHVEDEIADQNFAEDVVSDLETLVAAAIAEGNIKLAYRIERTIDEIVERDTPCI